MDYNKMSDQEINQEVTCILNPDAQKMALIGDGSCFYDCGPDGNGFYEIPVLNYCNNPEYAYPIIYKNGISIGIYGYGEWGAGGIKHTHIDGVNPLRAAMIVFLMMQE